jgi:hypothetical protein
MAEPLPPAKFELNGPCRSGGTHLIVPRTREKDPFAGVAYSLCWKCKSVFLWVVGPPEMGGGSETVEEGKKSKKGK